jgi:hypothetical protein
MSDQVLAQRLPHQCRMGAFRSADADAMPVLIITGSSWRRGAVLLCM